MRGRAEGAGEVQPGRYSGGPQEARSGTKGTRAEIFKFRSGTLRIRIILRGSKPSAPFCFWGAGGDGGREVVADCELDNVLFVGFPF